MVVFATPLFRASARNGAACAPGVRTDAHLVGAWQYGRFRYERRVYRAKREAFYFVFAKKKLIYKVQAAMSNTS